MLKGEGKSPLPSVKEIKQAEHVDTYTQWYNACTMASITAAAYEAMEDARDRRQEDEY